MNTVAYYNMSDNLGKRSRLGAILCKKPNLIMGGPLLPWVLRKSSLKLPFRRRLGLGDPSPCHCLVDISLEGLQGGPPLFGSIVGPFPFGLLINIRMGRSAEEGLRDWFVLLLRWPALVLLHRAPWLT